MLMATTFSKNDALILTFNLPVLFLIGIFTYFSWYKPFGPVSSLTTSTLHKKYLISCEHESTLIRPKPFLSLLVIFFFKTFKIIIIFHFYIVVR